MKRFQFLCLTGFIFLSWGVSAQNEKDKKTDETLFSVDGEFRNRFELSPSVGGRNVLVPQNTMSSMSFWQRSRISVSYSGKQIETKFSFQDVRPFVDNGFNSKSDNGLSFSVHEAWAKYYFINTSQVKWGLKLGRQEVNNSDERIIGKSDWDHYGVAFDAISLELLNVAPVFNLNLGFSLNSDEIPGTATKYRTLVFLNAGMEAGEYVTVNFCDLMEGYDDLTGISKANYVRNTFGFNPVFNVSALSLDLSFYFQHGTPNVYIGDSSNSVKYSGKMYTANLYYTFGPLKLGAGYDYYSGEAYNDTTFLRKDNVFNSPYFSGHRFFGNTDFHLKLLGKGRGLTNVNFNFSGDLNKKTDFLLGMNFISLSETHSFSDNLSNTVEYKSVGKNIDLVLGRKLGEKLNLRLGYSIFLPKSDYVRENNMSLGLDINTPAKFHGWGWVMFSFKPNLFRK
jgi:hypothetical protein